jgi:DNA processing protein
VSGACDDCLRRGYLVGLLAPRIAGLLGRSRRRPPGLLALSDEELALAVGGARGREEALAFIAGFQAERARADLRRCGVWTACAHRDGYPRLLDDLADSPAALFCVGRRDLLAALDREPAVTVVGTRDASPYGLDVAYDLGRGLGAAGMTTISGMARGVDAAAHRGALGACGATIAVLACGPDVPYPRSNRQLHRQIGEQGLVLSELPPGQRAYRWSFPARNRLMAALAQLTVVVEAGESSGTLITVDFAQQLGRAVAAVPGRVTMRVAAGSNRLLREGAPVIRDAGDVLDELLGPAAHRAASATEPTDLDPLERRLLDAVEAGLDMDAICAFAGLPVNEARVGLARLETRGLLRRDGLFGWERARGG